MHHSRKMEKNVAKAWEHAKGTGEPRKVRELPIGVGMARTPAKCH